MSGDADALLGADRDLAPRVRDLREATDQVVNTVTATRNLERTITTDRTWLHCGVLCLGSVDICACARVQVLNKMTVK